MSLTVKQAIWALSLRPADKKLLELALGILPDNVTPPPPVVPVTPTYYGNKQFKNPANGFVFTAQPNNTLWRLYVDDTDANYGVASLESVTTPASGDILITLSGAGVVMSQRSDLSLQRINVDDSDLSAPVFTINKLNSSASVTIYDFWLAPGVEFTTIGRGNGGTWGWFVDETFTDSVLSIEKL